MNSALWVLAALAVAGTGCVSAWWNAFLDPTQVGNFRQTNLVNEIQKTISFRDKPSGIPAATDPTPDDLVATVEEYETGPGDELSIRMLDFVARNTESVFDPTPVDDLGYIDIAQLGQIQVEGLTMSEIRDKIIRRAKDRGIYAEDYSPTVTVLYRVRRHRLFDISGAISAPGQYGIPTADFRLREALNMAGGLPDAAKEVYIFRGEARHKQVVERPSFAEPGGAGEPPVMPDLPAPPVVPTTFSEVMGSPGAAEVKPAAASEPGDRPDTGEAPLLPLDESTSVLKELDQAVSPTIRDQGSGTTAPSDPEIDSAAPANQPVPQILFLDDDKWTTTPTPTTQKTGPVTTAPVATAGPEGETVDWESLATEGQQRIIRIPADRLRKGDANYNIVIQHRDSIRVDPGPIGFYYLGGHVLRPGPYSLTGERVTLTQAIFAAGGFDALAWPTRCEIRRRIDEDREEITQWDLARIMEGQDPDLFLKANDVINVGTHAVAPFLATIRNSFRLTYGFGFVYDRNFADYDAFFAQTNPKDRYRRELQALLGGIPLGVLPF